MEYNAFLTAEDMFGMRLKNPESIIIQEITIKEFTLSEYGRYFQWTPKKMDLGKHDIHFRITDEYGFTTFYTHNISVFNNPCYQCDSNPIQTPSDTTGN